MELDTMVEITAALIHSETGYSTDDISTTNLEYLIDNSINYVNLMAGTSISNLSGAVAGSKTVTVTADQAAVLKPLINLLLMAYMDAGQPSTVQGLSVQTTLQTPRYAAMMKLLDEGLLRLRRHIAFERV